MLTFARRHIYAVVWLGFVAAMVVVDRLTPDRFNFLLLAIELGSIIVVWAYSINRDAELGVVAINQQADTLADTVRKLESARVAVFDAYISSIRRHGDRDAETQVYADLYREVAEIIWPVADSEG